MQTLFISDLHLCQSRPHKIQLFSDFLAHLGNDVDALYILGDLFEAWYGDDPESELNEHIIRNLASVTKKGTVVYMMRGNRDFLLDERFTRQTGVKLLPDPYVVDLYGTRTLLMHGDLLCTDDTRYQRFRKISNCRILQSLFLLTPLKFRQWVAGRARKISSDEIQLKPDVIMDVTESTVHSSMTRFKVHELIHGHTHKQAEHHFDIDGFPARRIVLGDWYESDSVLVYTKEKQKLMRIKDYLAMSVSDQKPAA